MRHPAGELAERVELLRLGQVLLHLLELELGLAPLGRVAGDLGKTDQFAALVDRIDHDAGPEEGAVLAHPPAVVLVAPGLPGGRQRTCWLAVGAIGLGVEAGEMLAEDFLRRVALDALRADVPAGHDPGGIEHEQRVVRDALDK